MELLPTLRHGTNDQHRYDIADIVAFEDCERYVYVAGDGTRAYSPKKLESFKRQIVFVRPGTFVIFDRVVSRDSNFRATWLLQAMKRPGKSPTGFVITNGKGRLSVQTLLPRDPQVKLSYGQDQYRYGGHAYPPRRDTGPAPECRIEVSPPQPRRVNHFLHVLTATDATNGPVTRAELEETEEHMHVSTGVAVISFARDGAGGYAEIDGRRRLFPDQVLTP